MVKKKKKYEFGLLGKNISYSFSKKYFSAKFKNENLSYQYNNFDIENISELPLLLNDIINDLIGFNITIPYKEEIFKYLDEVDEIAKKIGAVNTVTVVDGTYLKGSNTDYYGFLNSIKPLLQTHHKFALILGNGGATKAIKFALESINIDYIVVSRNSIDDGIIAYSDIMEKHFSNSIIINCTPLGTFPEIDKCPNIPYEFINKNNLLFDLVYNPEESMFLKKGKENGATIKNGLEMLELQAEKSFEIWNKIT